MVNFYYGLRKNGEVEKRKRLQVRVEDKGDHTNFGKLVQNTGKNEKKELKTTEQNHNHKHIPTHKNKIKQ